jgi:DNA recombination protein RmuC
MGDDDQTARLAGIHAMAQLADEWVTQRQTCIDVLCAFLRVTGIPTQPQPDDLREARRTALRRHASQVEQRVRELGQKSYWEQFEHSPEFAVLFLPGDQFLSAALAENPDLIESALKQRIIVTTPSTLMALLKVIAYGWRQNLVTENAREIRKLGEDLHKRLNVFVTHLQKVSRSLGSAVESFNASIGSMERNVLPQARKFTELGVVSDSLPSVEPIETQARSLASEQKPPSDDGNANETPN